jgi:protein gp37
MITDYSNNFTHMIQCRIHCCSTPGDFFNNSVGDIFHKRISLQFMKYSNQTIKLKAVYFIP